MDAVGPAMRQRDTIQTDGWVTGRRRACNVVASYNTDRRMGDRIGDRTPSGSSTLTLCFLLLPAHPVGHVTEQLLAVLHVQVVVIGVLGDRRDDLEVSGKVRPDGVVDFRFEGLSSLEHIHGGGESGSSLRS